MDEKNIWLELPAKLTSLMMDNMKRNQELTLSFFQQWEKNQRDFMKSAYELMNITIPGEEKIWSFQNNLIEQGIKSFDDSYEKLTKIWK